MALLKNGVKQAPGGKRANAGRKPDWFIEKCKQIGTSEKALAFLKSVIEGDPVEEKKILTLGSEPITIWESASVDARVRAWNSVMDRGFGKSVQPMEHNVQGRFILVCEDAPK